jgi:hypothetical protein
MKFSYSRHLHVTDWIPEYCIQWPELMARSIPCRAVLHPSPSWPPHPTSSRSRKDTRTAVALTPRRISTAPFSRRRRRHILIAPPSAHAYSSPQDAAAFSTPLHQAASAAIYLAGKRGLAKGRADWLRRLHIWLVLLRAPILLRCRYLVGRRRTSGKQLVSIFCWLWI